MTYFILYMAFFQYLKKALWFFNVQYVQCIWENVINIVILNLTVDMALNPSPFRFQSFNSQLRS